MSVIHPNGASAIEDRDRRGARDPHPNGGGDAGACTRAAAARGMSRRLLERVAMLPTRDRAIVELTLRSNLSCSRVGRTLDISPGQVSRRLRTLYARLHDPLVIRLVDERCPLAVEHRQLAIEHFLQGQSAPRLAEKHRLSSEQVRRMLAQVKWWHRGACGAWGGKHELVSTTFETNLKSR